MGVGWGDDDCAGAFGDGDGLLLAAGVEVGLGVAEAFTEGFADGLIDGLSEAVTDGEGEASGDGMTLAEGKGEVSESPFLLTL